MSCSIKKIKIDLLKFIQELAQGAKMSVFYVGLPWPYKNVLLLLLEFSPSFFLYFLICVSDVLKQTTYDLAFELFIIYVSRMYKRKNRSLSAIFTHVQHQIAV